MYCQNTFMVKRDGEAPVAAPCGKCIHCYKRNISQWSFRLMQEEKHSISSSFITLTYDPVHLPIGKVSKRMELRKNDLQKFFKRLRDHHQRKPFISKDKRTKPIKYYCVGEYGATTARPHYHAIVFNCDIELISKAWTQGSIYYGDVSFASVGYVLKYLNKNNKLHRSDPRPQPFRLSSIGLGLDYLTPEMIAWHKADIPNRYYCQAPGNIKLSMPRYYKQKIYTDDERLLASTVNREKLLVKQLENEMRKLKMGVKNHVASHYYASQRQLHYLHQKSFL